MGFKRTGTKKELISRLIDGEQNLTNVKQIKKKKGKIIKKIPPIIQKINANITYYSNFEK